MERLRESSNVMDGKKTPHNSAGLLSLVFKLISMNTELMELAITDGLTGIYNYRFFFSSLEKEMERVKRYNKSLILIMIDIDNFKQYNDESGHQRGDEALEKIARILESSVRSMDLVARYGGDEFAIILPHTDDQEGAVVAARIRKAIDAENFPLTISMGIACYKGEPIAPTDLISKADLALYNAKYNGKNQLYMNL